MARVSINIAKGTIKKDSLVLGIDLGTTNSLVAVVNQETGKPYTLKDGSKNIMVPSILYFDKENKQFIVGDLALSKLEKEPEQTVYSVKRFMGKSYKDVLPFKNYFGFQVVEPQEDGLVHLKINGVEHSPIELSAKILSKLKEIAQKNLGQEIRKAVITVPAYFNDAQRQATRDAGKLAGLDVLRIINEPTAASLAYGVGLDTTTTKTIAVYDLGGGTFDISILQIEEGVFEVLATNGDTFLGGDDIDRAIIDYWLEELNDSPLSKNEMQQLRLKAERAKIELTAKNQFTTKFKKQNLSLSVNQLDRLAKPFIDKTIKACKKALADAELDEKNIDEVILVGGSTRLRIVKQVIKQLFNESHINTTVNPDEVVALGAALEGDILAGNRSDILLLDVTPLSLGIETVGGLMDVIIPRNSKVPTKVGRNYTTSVDGQVKLKVAIYQGESDQISKNRKLAEFVLNNIPAMPAGFPKIEIDFLLDADGILQVKAVEKRSGITQNIEVKPQYGLTDTEVEKMLSESIRKAQEDRDYRTKHEAINEANYLVLGTKKFLTQNAEIINNTELKSIKTLISTLENNIEHGTKDEILKSHLKLDDFTKPFAEKAMNNAVTKALKGKNIIKKNA